MVHILKPPTADESAHFMQDVKNEAPTVLSQIRQTMSEVWKAVGSTLGTVVTAPLSIPKAAINIVGNAFGGPSTFSFWVGKRVDNMQKSVSSSVSGLFGNKEAEASAAPMGAH